MSLEAKSSLMSQKLNNINKGGVKTDEGKAVSKYNAQKHSILRDLPTEYETVEIEQLEGTPKLRHLF
jgi:hypothetical protein